TASVTLIVARSLGAGAAQELTVPGVRALAIGDFDADGVADLAAATGAGQPLFLFMNRPSGNGARVALDATPIPVGNPFDAVDIAAADLDADGDIDLVAADSSGAHRLLINDGSASFAASPIAGGPQSEAVEIGDVDG